MSSTASILSGVGLLSGGVTSISQLFSGREEKRTYDYNAMISEQEAGMIRQGADLDEARERKRLGQFVGSQMAATASSGVEFTGSPIDVISDTIANAELEMEIGRYNSEMAARRKESEAELGRRYGRAAERSSQIMAAGTFLSTVGDFGSKYIGAGSSKKSLPTSKNGYWNQKSLDKYFSKI